MVTYPQPAVWPNHAVQQFIQSLLAQPIRAPAGVAPAAHPLHHQPTLASYAVANPSYPPDECWFNCVDYCVNKDGTIPVFGWAIWQAGPSTLVAQHHAVVDDSGALIDVSLGPIATPLLFVPDNNAPFDFNALRFPFSFEQSPAKQLWFSTAGTSPTFAIAKAPSSPRASAVIAAGRAAGVI